MFLNLRNTDSYQPSSRPSGIVCSLPEIDFVQTRFLGNIGGPAYPEQCDDDHFDEEEEERRGEDGMIENGDGHRFAQAHSQNGNTTLIPVVSGIIFIQRVESHCPLYLRPYLLVLHVYDDDIDHDEQGMNMMAIESIRHIVSLFSVA